MLKHGVCLVACALAIASAPEVKAQERLSAPIVNGVTAPGQIAPVGLVFTASGGSCSGTLIGCRTVLTAAHCICPGTSPCAAPPFVFFQHLGGVAVESAVVHPGYVPQQVHDIAVLRLATAVKNLPIAQVNMAGRVPYGSPAVLAGFGRAIGGDPSADFTNGIMRVGQASTSACQINDGFNLCANFLAPLGAPGEDSGSCQGDSGGPLFTNGLVAGVVSYGQQSCLPPNQTVYSDTFIDRAWIIGAAGGDLGLACEPPRVGEAGVAVASAEGNLTAGDIHQYDLEVPPGSAELRVTLMPEHSADIDLEVLRLGSRECLSELIGPLPEGCVVSGPTPGTRQLRVSGFAGAGNYQLVATTITSASTPPVCIEDATTACLLNNRFQATVRFRLGFDDSPADTTANRKTVTGFANPSFETEFFYFGDPNNIEVILKMLDQGNTNGSGQPTIAVLTGTATPLRAEVTIVDTATGVTRTFISPFSSQRGATDFQAFVK